MNIRQKRYFMNTKKKRILSRCGVCFCVLLLFVPFILLLIYSWAELDAFVDACGVMCTFVGMLLVLKEINQNKIINEAELVIRINSEFINNPELVKVEHQFERYFYQYNLIESINNFEQEFDVNVKLRKKKLKKKEQKSLKKMKEIKEISDLKLDLDLDIDSHERQELVNYLVHLESVATLVNNGILRLEVISDLVAYRYFIAVNNPHVQKYELIPYKEYYMGCYKIYKKWKNLMEYKNMNVPMGKNGKIFEEFME